MIKHDLLYLFGRGQIGWRANSFNAYAICMFIRSLENTVRMVNGGKKHHQIEMPEFESLFGYNGSTKSKEKEKDVFGEFMDSVDKIEDDS